MDSKEYCYKKLLFFANAGLGDICQAMPFLLALDTKRPCLQVEISYATNSAKDLVKLFLPRFTGIVVPDLDSMSKKILKVINWRLRNFDYFVSGGHLDSFKTACIAYLVRAKKSIGMEYERISSLYSIAAPETETKYTYASYGAMFVHLGINPLDVELGRHRFAEELANIAKMHRSSLLPKRIYPIRIALANGADNIKRGKWRPSLKRLPDPTLRAIFTEMTQKLSADFILLGGKQDTFPSEIKTNSRVTDLRGKTDISALISILQDVDLLLCNDSGLMHLAHFCGIPNLALFGPTDAEMFAPIGPISWSIQAQGSCSGCKPIASCGQDICRILSTLDIDEVVFNVQRILTRLRANGRHSAAETSNLS